MRCFFVSDLHGRYKRYHKLFSLLRDRLPSALFMGGDLLPHGLAHGPGPETEHPDFVGRFLVDNFARLRDEMGKSYPDIFVILGNDDGRFEETAFIDAAAKGVWNYVHDRKIAWHDYMVYGYAFVPPTPFQLKDWEKYDVSRYTDPGCVSPEQGFRVVNVSEYEKRYSTIAKDLEVLGGGDNLENALLLFHTPPYKTLLDKADLDGKMIDHAPLDPHVGSIAVRRFIEKKQPLITLHGHIHESTRLTGAWRDKIGKTHCFNAAHDGSELAVIEFDPACPEKAERFLI